MFFLKWLKGKDHLPVGGKLAVVIYQLVPTTKDDLHVGVHVFLQDRLTEVIDLLVPVKEEVGGESVRESRQEDTDHKVSCHNQRL